MTVPNLVVCPECGSDLVVLNGHTRGGNQRYSCKNKACRHRFSDGHNNLKADKSLMENRQVCVTIRGAKNLDAQAIEKACAGDNQLIEFAWQQKKRGLCDSTIDLRVSVLRRIIQKGGVLNNPDTVTTVLAVEPLTKAQKYQWAACYRSYTKTMKIPWDPPRVRYQPDEPFIGTEEEMSAFVHGAGTKSMATFYQVAMTTGARVGEICKLKWTDVNTEDLTISINDAEKGSNNRTIPVPMKTIAMINDLPKKHGIYLFNTHTNTLRANHINLRRKLADIEKNPRFNRIKLHTFRHFFAREKIKQGFKTEYVQQLLGHASILNTERYTKMIHHGNEKYYSEVADTVEKARQLAEDGWTYFAEINGTKIFRKPR